MDPWTTHTFRSVHASGQSPLRLTQPWQRGYPRRGTPEKAAMKLPQWLSKRLGARTTAAQPSAGPREVGDPLAPPVRGLEKAPARAVPQTFAVQVTGKILYRDATSALPHRHGLTEKRA